MYNTFGAPSNPYATSSYGGGSGSMTTTGFGGFNGQSTANQTGAGATSPTAGANTQQNPFSGPNAAGGTMPWWNMYQARTAVMPQMTQQTPYNTGFVPQSQGGSMVPPPQVQGNVPRFSGVDPNMFNQNATNMTNAMGMQFGWDDPRTRGFADRAFGDLRSGAYNQPPQGQQQMPQQQMSPFSQQQSQGEQSPYTYNPKIQAAGQPGSIQEKLSSYTLGTMNNQGLYSAVPAYSKNDPQYNPNQPVYNGIIGMSTTDPNYDILYKAYNPQTMGKSYGLLENRYSPDQMIKIPKTTRNTYTTGLQAGTPGATQNAGLGSILNLPEVKEGRTFAKGGRV